MLAVVSTVRSGDARYPGNMAEAEDTQNVTWIFANGDALEFRVRGWPAGSTGTVVRNGGLTEASLIIATYVAAGVIGNGAYDALKLGLRLLRLRLAWGSDDEKSRYVAYIAQLAVAAKLTEPTEVKVISCSQQRDYWETVILAGASTFRVQIPPNDPRPTAISVDVE